MVDNDSDKKKKKEQPHMDDPQRERSSVAFDSIIF